MILSGYVTEYFTQ